ncbi:hypothetical protein [Kitasatospora cheerisanensis]|uniref:Uncharacterized protein n=1 Tax=Kitasatospora cheerisanensis KCTC 2395 TaxID=1348663 RepID=A0A066YRG7_9ACTN|nr:hypothetical protein [Kitasatospora cheerisanensis]KDN82584.1 hypothetical protein KCH_56530 [Kitasatospora cheerisanensis KCTC 2395]
MNEKKAAAARPWRGALYALTVLLGCGVPVGLLAARFGGSEGVDLLHVVTPTAMVLVVALRFRTKAGGVAAFAAGALAFGLSFTGIDAVRAGALADRGEPVAATVTAVHPRSGSTLPSCELSRPDGTAIRYRLSPCSGPRAGSRVLVTADPEERQAPVVGVPDADTPLREAVGLLTALTALLLSLPLWAARRPQAG